MRRNRFVIQSKAVALAVALPLGALLATPAIAQPQLDGLQLDGTLANGSLVEPIFRIDHEQPVGQPTQVAARIAVAKPQQGFDLTQLPGEHPLMPALRVAKNSLETIDTRVRDYNAVMIKRERINGTLAPQEIAFVKVRHQPFSVYMYFLGDKKGRECIYNDLPDGSKGNLVARDSGFKKRLGKFTLDPEGGLAMKGQKYPIMKLGIRELTKELISVATNDAQFDECEVTHGQGVMEGRPITMLKVVHPTRRDNFRFHIAELFIDNELQIPVRYNAYTWPTEPGGEPLLEESYTYVKLKINNGYTDEDFDPESPANFK
jgi:hypothetical protein